MKPVDLLAGPRSARKLKNVVTWAAPVLCVLQKSNQPGRSLLNGLTGISPWQKAVIRKNNSVLDLSQPNTSTASGICLFLLFNQNPTQ